jgi:hypothetical protein
MPSRISCALIPAWRGGLGEHRFDAPPSCEGSLPLALRLAPVGYLNDAEAVAVGIFQYDEIVIRMVFLRVPGGPDPDQPLHLTLLVGRVEVQVNPAGLAERLKGLSNPIEGRSPSR